MELSEEKTTNTLARRFMLCCLELCKHDISVEELKHICNLLHMEESGTLYHIPAKIGDVIYRVDVTKQESSEREERFVVAGVVMNMAGGFSFQYEKDGVRDIICTSDCFEEHKLYLDRYAVYLNKEEARENLDAHL